jgi:molecular chaperone GrpE (heat shock protein)
MTAKSIAIDIADKAANFLNKLKFKDANLEFISVFSQSQDEYETYTEELLENGELLAESSTGAFVILERPLTTSLGGIKVIKIRKPSEERNSLGNVNYSVTDFQEFLNHYSNSDYFAVSSDSEGIKLVTLEEPDTDYFVVVRESSLLDKLTGEAESVSEFSEEDNASDETVDTDLLDSKVSELEQKLQEETNRRLSLMSDFQNYQKRIEGEKSLFGAMANMGIISSVLEIHDDLELAMNDETLDLENAKNAIKTAQSKIVQTVASAGVESILVKIGDDFNKEHMEAVSMIQAPNEEMKGKVIAVISSAYKYRDREGVFKPAKVVVGK